MANDERTYHIDKVNDIMPSDNHIQWNLLLFTCKFKYFNIQYNPKKAKNINIGSIKMNRDCVKSALSATNYLKNVLIL